jgi:hypothetical protein
MLSRRLRFGDGAGNLFRNGTYRLLMRDLERGKACAWQERAWAGALRAYLGHRTSQTVLYSLWRALAYHCDLLICVAVLAADRVRPRWSGPSCSRRPLCPRAGAGRLPDGLWISDRHAIGFHDQCRAHALVLGHQRRCRCSRCKHCRCHQHCVQHRYNAQNRSCLLSLGRRSSRIVGVRSCAIQPHGTTTPAPTQKRECVE